MEVKCPEVTVDLVGQDGNAFVILGLVCRGMKRGGVDESIIDEFRNEAMSGDYDNLLVTVMKYVNVA